MFLFISNEFKDLSAVCVLIVSFLRQGFAIWSEAEPPKCWDFQLVSILFIISHFPNKKMRMKLTKTKPRNDKKETCFAFYQDTWKTFYKAQCGKGGPDLDFKLLKIQMVFKRNKMALETSLI